MMPRLFRLTWLALGFLTTAAAQTAAREMTLTPRTRDPATGQVVTRPLKIDASKVGIVIVDPWNYHWCMTWTEQAGGMTPRMNKALAGARKLGMAVLWAPTDAASMYSGRPQRERAMAFPYLPVPHVRNVQCKWSVVATDACLCGPGVACLVNYGWDGMDPRLEIAEGDLIVSGTQELYSICKAQGITLLIYFGGATNMCLTGKDIGLGPMFAAGLDTFFARDMAFAWTTYDPAKGETPSTGNAQAADDLERSGIPTLVFVDELRKVTLWDDAWVTEPVRVTPAGTTKRPYLFEDAVAVTLEIPFVENARIHYTLDGTEPTSKSPLYQTPITLIASTRLRAAAFREDKQVSLESAGSFTRLPAMPPKPGVPLDSLVPIKDLYTYQSAFLWHPVANHSYENNPLRIRGRNFAQGLGMRAPAYARYDLQPEWSRFVALVGIDDKLLDRDNGANIAQYPSVVFKVIIDGRLAAESPVMRISQVPWRFDVPIPSGSRQLTVVCDDAESRSPYDLGNWVEAGFLLQQK